MLDYLERQTKLTGNQYRLILTATLSDMLLFFDYFLIGYVVAFIAGPWKLTFGQSAVILLSSGFGAIFGSAFYGWLADQMGRRKVFMITVLNGSLATGLLALTPEGSWLFIAALRFIAGLGVGGLYCVNLPLVQEFVPSSRRGWAGGLVGATVPLGVLIASVLASSVTPYVGWRGLFAIGALPAALNLLARHWVPESPRWLIQMGRLKEAREALAWALEMNPADLPAAARLEQQAAPRMADLLKYPRSLLVTCAANLGAQTGSYGVKLWLPTLVALTLGVGAQRAAFLLIWVNLAGFFGRLMFSWMSDAIGRRASVGISGFSTAAMLVTAAFAHSVYIGPLPVFWVLLIVVHAFMDGGWSIIGPYSSEIWPANLRATGMGFAYGFGGFGKVIGPLGLAVIVGSSNIITPAASMEALLPAFGFLASCFFLVSTVFLLFARETRGRSLEAIDSELGASAPAIARQPVL